MSVASLLVKLTAAGVSIGSDGGRLIVEAPPGVLTADLRTTLVRSKAELLAALEGSTHRADQDPALTHAVKENAGLLARAYRRCSVIQQVGTPAPSGSGNDELASPAPKSVHGVVE